MKKFLAGLLALCLLLSLSACGGKEPGIADAANKLNKLPVQQEETEKAETDKVPEKPQTQIPVKEEPQEEPAEDPEPSQGLDFYANPADHPHEGTDLTVYDGIYRAKVAQDDDEETWLQIKGYNDFILLEYHGLQAGEIYRYWAEEFWPGEGWYTSRETETVFGKSQQFTSMAQYENYSGLPQNRCITLTEDGVVLNYDDSDAEYFVRDNRFYGGHNSPEELRGWFGEDTHLDFDYQYDSRDVLGTWAFWDGWQAVSVTFAEDGGFSLYWKIPNEPIRVYEGAYGFGVNSGNLEILAEQVGYGCFPMEANWEWYVDDWGYLNLSSEEDTIFLGQYCFWPVEDSFFTALDADSALGYIVANFTESGDYTDQYGNDYIYYYSLPQFYYSENADLQKINSLITDAYYPIIEMEQRAMAEGEILSYDHVDWDSSVYNGVLFLHVYAYTYDWEEHHAFYIDLATMEQLQPEEMLRRVGIAEDLFLDTIRAYAEDSFVRTFSDLPEADREEYGYYDCLEQTVSDEFVNLDLPILVTKHGEIRVWVKLSSMAGSGIIWQEAYPFAEPETAVG